ncbi:hypothetical protein CspeluHIS016_0211500 [Cutaneotrichosporon spelunceum]|uniref:Uncharacterized protein n=1 Tax=Cutaneotrichosporon spelunceum TaxID=1672016 RepID=A0AAD3YBS2_9TREE|nr:hypothetical protein CspeluHIS016_0211500 [Cutaneotrichosporon spelunceum]
MPSAEIHVSGEYTVKRAPELVDLNLRIHAERPTAPDALEAVRAASTDVSSIIRNLAPPPKTEVSVAIDNEELDINDEARDPAFPVTSWSMQQLRTWSETISEDTPRPPRPQARMMMASSTATEEEEKPKPQKVFHAETYVRATFHDFAKLSAVIEAVISNDIISIDDLAWRVTRATRQALQTRVRQGAYADALTKATDYAATIAPGNIPCPTEVHDDSMGHRGGRVFKAQAMMAMVEASDGAAKAMTFEPEPIEISAQVRAELGQFSIHIRAKRRTASDALDAIRTASADVCSKLRSLVPPNAEVHATTDSEDLDIIDDVRDPDFPVTSWTMYDGSTWSEPSGEYGFGNPHAQAFVGAAAEQEEMKPKKVFYAQTTSTIEVSSHVKVKFALDL